MNEVKIQAKAAKPALKFSPVQKRVIDSRGKNLLVSASAGAGKTAVLVERLYRMVIEDHISIENILAMTFTEDAASEMKVRLRQKLQENSEDPWVSNQLSLLETASISTIHSFCLNLLQEYYYLIPISYTMASTVDTGLRDEQALERAYDQSVEKLDPSKWAALKLYLSTYGQTEEDLRQSILKFLEIARTKPDPEQWMTACKHTSSGIAEWFFQYFEVRIHALMSIFAWMEEQVEQMSFTKAKKKEEYLLMFENKVQHLESCLQWLAKQEYAKFANRFIEYIETTGKFTPTINKIKFEQESKDARRLEKEIASVLFSQKEYEKIDTDLLMLKDTFVTLAQSTREMFAKEKEKEQFIDFSDMEQFAWQLLQMPEVAAEIRKRYETILVDEYQDTNDLQESIISAFARENNVFRVGDIKQSIYGFRQARPSIMKQHMLHPGQQDEVIYMSENYRSAQSLIAFNNDFYSKLMNTEPLTRQFEKEDRAVAGTEAQKAKNKNPVRFLYTCYEGWEDPSGVKTGALQAKSAHKKHRADLIAADIQKKITAGDIQARDVAILSRSTTQHEHLKQVLESWGIRSISHVKKGFYLNKAVQIVLSALRVIQDPRNDIALMALLGSPLSTASEQEVMKAAMTRESGQSLYNAIRTSEHGMELLQCVWDLRKWKDLPLGELLSHLYNYKNFYNAATTSQDKTNLDLLLEKAVSAENALDLEGFLDSAGLEENLNKTSEAIPFGKEEDAVKIGTIHSSKGLQYKLVYILCEETNRDMDGANCIVFDPDLGLSFAGVSGNGDIKQKSASHVAFAQKRFMEDLEEKMRLLYVATTRAEEELVLVDAIREEDDYSKELNVWTLLNNKGFTSWFFHVYWDRNSPLVEFDKVETLLERPDQGIYRQRPIQLLQYDKPVSSYTSNTASEAKVASSWPARELNPQQSTRDGRQRGTLFHEMAQHLSWPYQRQDAENFGLQYGIALNEEDLDQFLALNENPTYASWMEQEHKFECPYSVFDPERGEFTHGYMDLIVWKENEIAILDFKTDMVFDAGVLFRRYAPQLETYRKAIQKIYPNRQVNCYIYSFHLKEMLEMSKNSNNNER